MKPATIKQNTVFRWVISYLPPLLIALLLGAMLYGYSMRAVQEKAETIQHMMQENRAEALETLFGKINDISVRLQGNELVSELANCDTWGVEERLKLGQVQQRLEEQVINNEEIRNIYLYFPGKRYLLDRSSAFSVDNEKMLVNRTGFTQTELFDMLSEDLYGTIHIAGDDPCLIYSFTYRKNEYFLKQPLILLVELSDSYMDGLLHMSEAEFILADEQGRYYHSSTYGENVEGMTAESALALSFEEEPMQWDGTTCVYRSELKNYPLALYSVQPEVGYVHALRNMQILLGLYLVVCLLGGGMLIWYQTKKNYRPVDEILTTIRRHGYLEQPELSGARQSLEDLIESYEERKDTLDRQQRELLSQSLYQLFLADWAENAETGDENPMLQEDIREILAGKASRVVRIRVEEMQETGLEPELLSFMINNVIEETFAGSRDFLFGELAGNYYLLTRGEELDRERLEQVSRFFQESCGLDVSVEVSGIHAGVKGARVAYDELCALAEYRSMLDDNSRVLWYEDCRRKRAMEDFYQMFRLERKLRQLAGERDPRELEKTMQAYLQCLESKTILRWRGLDINEKEETDRDLLDQVQEYIDRNYMDKQLTAGALAEKYRVSASWLSRNFKKEKGVGVLEYIGQARMEKAKELLAAGLTVAETAEQVGYYSSRPLVRLFTEKTGMTPMKYAKSQDTEQ